MSPVILSFSLRPSFFPSFLFQCYISTSDVQMHANYHRKDTAIIQEGFQRFRATEDCLTDFCPFQGQKTTHFHW